MSSCCVNWQLSRRLAAALLAAAAVGCSDASYRLGGATQSRGATRIGDCRDGADEEVLDKMEDGDGTIDMTNARAGVWFSFHDESGGTQVPASDHETFVMTELDPARGSSHFAARSYGGDFTDWGAGIGFELYSQKAYDLRGYAGIAFWARRAPGTATALRFAVTDAATAPRGGQCHEYVDYSTCSDYFGADVSLTTAFRRHSYLWSELEQDGWGEPRPSQLDTSAVYGVRFQVDPGEDFDFWIDDITLLCHPE
jgi:hypothetical protein